MKIAIIGSKVFDCLEYHLNDSLSFLGHNVFHIDIEDVISIPYRYNYWSQKIFKRYDWYIFNKIAHRIVDERPDLVIACYRFIHPDCINFIKKNLKKTKVIHINPDALTTFERQQIFISSYDAYFTKDPFIANFMKNKIGLNSFYLPEAFNQRIHTANTLERESLEKKIGIDTVCFGTMYPYRAKMVEKLIDSGIDVKLFGTPDSKFPLEKINKSFQNEYITGDRKAEILIGSKIVFNNFHYAEIESVNAKFFEIAGIGGFQICDYKPTVDEYTGICAEKFTYKCIEQAIELINYYLKKPNERYQLAESQRKHFLKYHTYDIRLSELLSTLEL